MAGERSRYRAKARPSTPAPRRRAYADLEEREPYAVYRLAVQLAPHAIGSRFSIAHPELRIEILNRMEVAHGRMIFEVRATGPAAAEYADAIRGYPEVTDVDLHPETPVRATYRLTMRTPPFHHVLRERQVLTRYPIVIERGWARFETVATASQVRGMLATMAERVGPSHVEAVRRGSVALGSLGLTPPQEELFRRAVSAGFFDTPRRTNLTSLAAELGRSKSAVSDALRRIQQQLANSTLQLGLLSSALGG